jgi:hypothetical protein
LTRAKGKLELVLGWPQRLGIITAEIMATASAMVRLALGDPIDPLGRDQGSAVPRVARLAATVTAGG